MSSLLTINKTIITTSYIFTWQYTSVQRKRVWQMQHHYRKGNTTCWTWLGWKSVQPRQERDESREARRLLVGSFWSPMRWLNGLGLMKVYRALGKYIATKGVSDSTGNAEQTTPSQTSGQITWLAPKAAHPPFFLLWNSQWVLRIS